MSQVTKRALGNSLKGLLQKKSLNRITVRDVVEDCGVNRQTFYYHFKDIYDLLEWIFNQDLDKVFKEQVSSLNWQEWCDILISYMQENRKFILNVCNSVNRERLEAHLKIWLRPGLEKLVDNFSRGKNYTEENKDFVINIYTIMLEGIMMEWVENDMKDEQLKNIDKLFRLMDGSISFMLEKLQ